MNIIYEGKDITDHIDIKAASIMDATGIGLDSIELVINNTVNEWSTWRPEKNQSIDISESGFKSGVHYIDDITQNKSNIVLKALPIKQGMKQTNTKAWNNIRLLELLGEFSNKHGLKLETYGIDNHYYSRIDQEGIGDLKFLVDRCIYEGYIVKITNNSLVVFNEKEFESKSPMLIRYDDSVNDFKYRDKSDGLYGGINIIWGSISYMYKSPQISGPILHVENIQVNSISEAERFAKNILTIYNKYEKTLVVTKSLDTTKASGNTVVIDGFGLCDGLYFIDQAIHNITSHTSVFKLRQIQGGY